MNGELISDALEYLDDDLIAQTDEVRRGVRVLHRPPVRGILAAAACAALVLLGIHSLPQAVENGAADAMVEQSQNTAAGSSKPEPTEGNYGYSTTSGVWRTVTVSGITVSIPPDWEWARLDTNEEWGDHIALSHGQKDLIIGYYPGFAVCGTGLEMNEIQIAGMEARVGHYDGHEMWDFIIFPDDYVAINNAGESWTPEERETMVDILDSVEIKEDAP